MKGLPAVCGPGSGHRGAQPVVRSVGGKDEGVTGCLSAVGVVSGAFLLGRPSYDTDSFCPLAKQVPSCPVMG